MSYVLHLAPVNNVLAPSKSMLLPRALLRRPARCRSSGGSAARFSGQADDRRRRRRRRSTARYLAIVAGCKGCHGPDLSGGKIAAGDPSWGPAANLTPSGNLGKWTEAQFVATLRTGKRPDGIALKEPMPWKIVGHMTDDELHAVWLYLRSVPPRAFGTHSGFALVRPRARSPTSSRRRLRRTCCRAAARRASA